MVIIKATRLQACAPAGRGGKCRPLPPPLGKKLFCIVLYCIMRPYTDGPIGPLSYRHSSGVVRNPHSTLAE